MLGHRIKELRISLNLSQEELGNKIGVTKVSICGYENGTRLPSLQTFTLLIDFFGTTADYLLGREINIINEDDNNQYIGYLSERDLEITRELKKHIFLYTKLLNEPKRTASLINSKMKNELVK